MTKYWSAALHHRLSRRRALAATGTTAAASAFLAACGGSSNNNKTSSGGSSGSVGSSLLSQPADQTGSPQKGGTLIGATATKFTTWDPMAIPAVPFKRVYNELFYLKAGKLQPGKGEIGGDIAESWEFSPDRLTLNIKLSQKAHFAPT